MVVWAVDGSGPAGGLLSRKAGWLAGALVSCLCGGGRGGWLSGVGIGNTPAVVVGRCGCCGRGGLLVVGVPVRACVRVGVACCRGSGVVRPGCLACGSASLLWGGVVGVGGLVVNCIVDASIITVLFL